jgi:hypothetical protein
MKIIAPEAPSAIRSNLGAIFFPRLRHIAASSPSSELNSSSSPSSDDFAHLDRAAENLAGLRAVIFALRGLDRTDSLSQTGEARTRPMGPK